METPLKFIKDYWPIIITFAIIMLAVGETRLKIANLENHKLINDSQWYDIRENGSVINALVTKTVEYDKVITPKAQQEWGEVKAAIKRHELELYRIHLRLGSRSFQPTITEDP